MPIYVGPAPTDWPSLVGARLLVRERASSDRYVAEVVVLEVSPRGDYLKLRHASGSESWTRTDEVVLVEVLPKKQHVWFDFEALG